MRLAGARTTQTVLFRYCLERKNNLKLGRVLSKCRVVEKKTTMHKRAAHVPGKGTHVTEPWGQRPAPLFGNHVTLDKSLNLFELVSLPLKGHTLTLSSLSYLLKTQTSVLYHRMSLLLGPFLETYGFLEFQSWVEKIKPGLHALALRMFY